MPETDYAKFGDLSLAYQVVGDGAVDVVVVPSFVTNIELFWTLPSAKVFLDHLKQIARLIIFDKAGVGLSDPVTSLPTPEHRVGEILAVMDEVGSERPILFGLSEGAPAAILTAASRPDRVEALMMFGAALPLLPYHEDFAEAVDIDPVVWLERWNERLRTIAGDEDVTRYMITTDQIARLQRFGRAIRDRWGKGDALAELMPSMPKVQCAMAERLGASPGMARATIAGAARSDLVDVLPTISVPTLVLHATGDLVPVQLGRYIADHIPHATYVEVEGREHAPWISDPDTCMGAITEFVTGRRMPPVSLRRRLATVLFTDMVGSTERATAMGDQQWRALLERFDEVVRTEVERSGGRLLKSMGDGHLSAFEGPGAAIICAQNLLERARTLDARLRAGIHTGECEMIGDDLGGIGVHIGARIGSLAEPDEILVSRTVRDLVVGSGFEFTERGSHALKGVPGEWQLLAVSNEEDDASPERRLREIPTPAPRESLRRRDRVVAAMARRTPVLLRAVARASERVLPRN